MPIEVLYLFLNGFFAFLILNFMGSLCILDISSLLDIYCLQISSPIQYMTFLFVGNFLHCAKAF